MSHRRAPMALRMPISRVRSVTVTNMMFMTPMPPTSREMAATAPSSTVKTSLVLWLVASRLAWFSTWNWVWPVALLWFDASTAVISADAASVAGARRGLGHDLVHLAVVAGEVVLHRGDGDQDDVVLVLEAVGALTT